MQPQQDDLIWEMRAFIYSHFVDTTRPPSIQETARRFDITTNEAARLFQELHERHAIFLEPGTLDIRMAFPFSGLHTDFQVQANGKTYFANCAWDMLGIPALLQSDAIIDAVCAESREPIRLEVHTGTVQPEDMRIHILLPFASWYDDMAFT